MPSTLVSQPVEIAADRVVLAGDLSLPAGVRALAVFAHGSGSGRHSPRNRQVATQLNQAGVGTLLVDLLTADEEVIDRTTAHLRFDIRLLADRLLAVAGWLARHPKARGLPLGYFGASTGAAAALIAAAERPGAVGAVVSRGGRPDLAGPALARVQAPTMLIVGGEDHVVAHINRVAYARLGCEKELVVVPGATHLFEEPGAIDEVARLARHWFISRLAPADAGIPPS
jgi:dienelactone hydrolase